MYHPVPDVCNLYWQYGSWKGHSSIHSTRGCEIQLLVNSSPNQLTSAQCSLNRATSITQAPDYCNRNSFSCSIWANATSFLAICTIVMFSTLTALSQIVSGTPLGCFYRTLFLNSNWAFAPQFELTTVWTHKLCSVETPYTPCQKILKYHWQTRTTLLFTFHSIRCNECLQLGTFCMSCLSINVTCKALCDVMMMTFFHSFWWCSSPRQAHVNQVNRKTFKKQLLISDVTS